MKQKVYGLIPRPRKVTEQQKRHREVYNREFKVCAADIKRELQSV